MLAEQELEVRTRLYPIPNEISRITCCGCSDDLALVVDLFDEKSKERLLLSFDEEIRVDLIGDGGDYKIRSERSDDYKRRYFREEIYTLWSSIRLIK